jgi:hypothetical protein
MARQQYRWMGEAAWQSSSGNAIVALQNLTGSGKKLLVHSFEIHPHQRKNDTASGLNRDAMTLARCTVSGGYVVPVCSLDTDATLPTGIEVRKFAAFGAFTEMLPINLPLLMGTALPGVRSHGSPWANNLFQGRRKDSSVEGIVLRPGEHLALLPDAARYGTNYAQPLIVTGDLVVAGSPKRTFTFSTMSWVCSDSNSLIAFVNDSASDVVTIKRIGVTHMGDTSTPYFRLVPLAAVDAQSQDDTLVRLAAVPMDSDYGALPATKAKLIANAPVLPSGVPQVYANDIGQGAPKGMSYLHTKDLVGPSYFGYFPELLGSAPPSGAFDMALAPRSQRRGNLLTPGAPIVLREGEALGVCSAMETAGTTSVSFTSGWLIFDFAIQFSVEPTVVPEIAISGVQPGSDVVILSAGTSAVLASGDAIAGSAFAWQYDADLVDTVDICVYKQGYVPWSIRNLDPGNSGVSLPISQVVDRNFVS